MHMSSLLKFCITYSYFVMILTQRVVGADCQVTHPLYHSYIFNLKELQNTGLKIWSVSSTVGNFTLNVCSPLQSPSSENDCGAAGSVGACLRQNNTFINIGTAFTLHYFTFINIGTAFTLNYFTFINIGTAFTLHYFTFINIGTAFTLNYLKIFIQFNLILSFMNFIKTHLLQLVFYFTHNSTVKRRPKERRK